MRESVCRICGQPASAHSVELQHSVAHTVIRDPSGNVVRECSTAWGDHEYLTGKQQALHTVARSLRQRAGRLDVKGYQPWYPDDLRTYAEKILRDARRFSRLAESIFKKEHVK